MTRHHIHFESAEQLLEDLNKLDNVKTITMAINHYIRFKKVYSTGFKYNKPTYKKASILIAVGDISTSIIVECG